MSHVLIAGYRNHRPVIQGTTATGIACRRLAAIQTGFYFINR